MRKIDALIVVNFLFGAAAPAKETCTQETFKVYYIDLETDFFEPPHPLEDSAQKVFETKSCQIRKLFTLATTQNRGVKNDEKLARIKIVRESPDAAITIDQERNVISKGSNLKVPSELVKGVLSELETKAKKTAAHRGTE